jgi:hypothetical protein
MTLENIANGAATVALAMIGGDPALTRQLQTLLGTIGLLDPPADGQFGPVSQWALAALLKQLGLTKAAVIDAPVATALLGAAASDPLPIQPRDTLAGRLVQALQARKHWIQRHPDCVNIVYVEGLDPDGTPNVDVPNEFNDLRVALRITPSGVPDILEAWEATTEPGVYYTVIAPLDPRGAARIAFGQYKAWSVGIHNVKSRKNAHEALVQTGSITVHRDLNQDFERTGDETFDGLFAINQHWGYDMKKSDIGRASAGCLVGRTRAGHAAFMKLCKQDPRYQANHSYRFMTAVLPAASVPPG